MCNAHDYMCIVMYEGTCMYVGMCSRTYEFIWRFQMDSEDLCLLRSTVIVEIEPLAEPGGVQF